MKHSVNSPTITEFFVPICIEKLSAKYYHRSTSLHSFCVYFDNFDFVCILCAKMQIREHGKKKRSGRTIGAILQVPNKCSLVNLIHNFCFCWYPWLPFFLWQLPCIIFLQCILESFAPSVIKPWWCSYQRSRSLWQLLFCNYFLYAGGAKSFDVMHHVSQILILLPISVSRPQLQILVNYRWADTTAW